MSSVPWSNETERADYYKKLYNEQLAICDRIEKEVERLKGRLESSDKQLEGMKESNARLYLRFNTAKSEAVKEFAESVDKIVTTRLKYYLEINEEKGVVYIPKFIIEKILEELKEMVGEG